jgi:hypothetical protein
MVVAQRKAIPVDVKFLVLHEAGYKCGNPTCRHVLTLDIHHMVRVADKGPDTAENLLALCPNCHSLHHRGEIPTASIRAWKMLVLALNEAFDTRSVDVLLALDKLGVVKRLTGDGIVTLAPLVAAGLVNVREYPEGRSGGKFATYDLMYLAELSEKGRLLVEGWKKGDQEAALAPNVSPAT